MESRVSVMIDAGSYTSISAGHCGSTGADDSTSIVFGMMESKASGGRQWLLLPSSGLAKSQEPCVLELEDMANHTFVQFSR